MVTVGGNFRYPTEHTIEIANPNTTQTDRFGNTRTTVGPYQPIQVAGWAVTKVEEQTGEQILRLIDQLEVYTPTLVDPAARIKIPQVSGVWEVQGNAEDYRHGPWWDPGLYLVKARKVEG